MKQFLLYLLIGAVAWVAFDQAELPRLTIPPGPAVQLVGQGETAVYNPPAAQPAPMQLPAVQPPAAPVYVPLVDFIDFEPFGGRLTYCYIGDWTDDQRRVMVTAFDSWRGAGVQWQEVSDWLDCQIHLLLTNEPATQAVAWASAGPGVYGQLPGRITMNLAYGMSAQVAAHEAGHILGLDHWDSGVMFCRGTPNAWPGPAEFAAVKKIWGIQ